MRWKRYLVLALAAGLAGWVLAIPAEPHDRRTVNALATQLFEFGAVRYFTPPDESDYLFLAVADGAVLDNAQSCVYRQAYSARVAAKARIFDLLDQDIEFRDDFGEGVANNCGVHGLAGHQDIHDLSAKNNIEAIGARLSALDNAGALARIGHANTIAKNLEDLMVHFAPAIHSLGVHHSEFAAKNLPPELAGPYGRMVAGFKTAQFAPVNSCAYWRGVDQALKNYADLVIYGEGVVRARLSTFEYKIAGRWLSPQTLAPRLDIEAPVRPRPDC